MEKRFHVYIVTSRPHGPLYTGVTSDLIARIYQHKQGVGAAFTSRYNLTRLVWFETHDHAEPAIHREKRLKKWNRAWKVRMIEETNPDWRDLYPDICR